MVKGDGKKEEREVMVTEQLKGRGINDESVLNAFRTVPRHHFVPEDLQEEAYYDGPLPIGEGQTISQPFIVAEMIEALQVEEGDRVLEIGTGSGYATALLSRIVSRVYTVERYEELADIAKERFLQLKYDNIEVRIDDGTEGWVEKSPFAGIMVSAAAPEIPQPLLEQLEDGGYLVVPVGGKGIQELMQIRKKGADYNKKSLGMVRFVPLIGKKGWKE